MVDIIRCGVGEMGYKRDTKRTRFSPITCTFLDIWDVNCKILDNKMNRNLNPWLSGDSQLNNKTTDRATEPLRMEWLFLFSEIEQKCL